MAKSRGVTKSEGKCSKLHAMWLAAGEGEILPRAFAIELAVAEGFNASTARTQYQLWFREARSNLDPRLEIKPPHYGDDMRVRLFEQPSNDLSAENTPGLTDATK